MLAHLERGYLLERVRVPTSPPVKCERMQETRAVEQCWSLVCVKPQCQLMEESEHAKTLTALADGQLQHLVQLLIGVVGREAQLVKTGVCSGQSAMCGGSDDLERGAKSVEPAVG